MLSLFHIYKNSGRDADAKELKMIAGRSYETNVGKSIFLWSYDHFSDEDTMHTVMQFTCGYYHLSYVICIYIYANVIYTYIYLIKKYI